MIYRASVNLRFMNILIFTQKNQKFLYFLHLKKLKIPLFLRNNVITIIIEKKPCTKFLKLTLVVYIIAGNVHLQVCFESSELSQKKVHEIFYKHISSILSIREPLYF